MNKEVEFKRNIRFRDKDHNLLPSKQKFEALIVNALITERLKNTLKSEKCQYVAKAMDILDKAWILFV